MNNAPPGADEDPRCPWRIMEKERPEIEYEPDDPYYDEEPDEEPTSDEP